MVNIPIHRFNESIFADLDGENPNRLGVSSYHQSEQLESFVRQQVAHQLARKRDYYSTDSSSPSPTDSHRSKRPRYT